MNELNVVRANSVNATCNNKNTFPSVSNRRRES
jgi:hypothetical protein